MGEQLPLFGNVERVSVREAISIFHEIEGKFKGPNYKYQYKPIIAFFAERHMDTINKVDIQNYRHHRENEGIKPTTANREHSVLTRLFNAFYEWRALGVVGSYNFHNVKLPQDNPGEQVKKVDERPFTRTLVLTPMEFFRFCDYAHPRVRVIAMVAVLTMLRRKNLSLLNQTNFNGALKQLQGVQSKTKLPFAVPATQSVTVILENNKFECVCDFTNFKSYWDRARRESGVYFQLRDLRRTAATQLLLENVDLRTIQKYLGHSSLVMTERYLQPSTQHLVAAGEKLEEKFGGVPVMSGFSTENK